RPPRWKILRRYVEVMGRTYRALARAADARVVVEASRWAPSPTALGLVPGVESYLLHLVRDPRAVIYSWNKREKRWVDRPGSPNIRYGALYSVTSWWARNFVAEMAASRRGRDRYVRYRYEDFIRDPGASLKAICSWLREPAPDLSFIAHGKAHMRPTHTVGGNPDRLRSGPIDIRPDDEWLTRMPLRDRIVGTALSIPLLQFYGYPLIPRQPAPARE
ncbi:MAG TPA: sulfotransferase, partial [Actinomycetota bacterium]|nr:sulfotransferase [Actinomycetota bacterium]